MAINLAELFVRVSADVAGLRQGLSDAQSDLQRMGDSMQRIGGRMTAAVTLPLVGLGAAAIKMSSDAEEAGNKFRVVMGDNVDRVNARLKELHRTIPLTGDEMQKLTAGMQDMLVPMGIARDEAADLSVDFLKLAGDVASFNNVSPEQALEAMRSGLAGQSRPLRQYGVDISKARLDTIMATEAFLALGIENERAATAQAIMMAIAADSQDAMGDAANTVDSTANSFRFFARNVKELTQAIGDQLVPMVLPLIRHLSAMVNWLGQLNPAFIQAGVVVGVLAATMGPLLLTLGTIVKLLPAIKVGLAALTGPIGLAVLAFGSMVAAGVAIVDNWNVIAYEVGRLVDRIRDALLGRFGAIVDGVRDRVEAVTGFFRDMYDKVVGNSFVPDMVDRIGQEFSRMGGIFDDGTRAIADFTLGSGNAISAFVNRAIADLTRLLVKMAVVAGLRAIFGGATGGFGGLVMGALDGGGRSVTPALAGSRNSWADAKAAIGMLPQPMTPKEAARDEWWSEFIRVGVGETEERA